MFETVVKFRGNLLQDHQEKVNMFVFWLLATNL